MPKKVRRKSAAALSAAAMVPLPPNGYHFDRTSPLPKAVNDANGSVYVDASTNTIHAPAGVKLNRRELAHEIGHVFRYSSGMTDADLARIAKDLHVPSQATRAGINPAEEWFADYYAAAATGDQPWKRTKVAGGGLRGGNDYTYATIGRKRLRRFRRDLGRIGERQNLGYGELYRPKNGPITGANPIEQDG